MNKRQLGTFYEQAVKEYLKANGIEVICMNYRCRIGEIDIIGKDGDCLIFFEVKFRKNKDYGMPLDAITEKKKNVIRKVALYYTAYNKWDGYYRFDCIGICGNEYLWIKNAF